MKNGLLVIASAVLATSSLALGATCPDRTPTAITSVAAGSLKCQDTIAKAGAKYLKTQLKTLAKCQLAGPAGSCPTADDTAKIEKEAGKGAEKIAKDCVGTAVGGLTSSYSSQDSEVISSCMLSQHNVIGARLTAVSTGVTTEPWPTASNASARANCVKTISKAALMLLDKASKNATKCISTQMKNAAPGNLTPVCVGSISGGTFVGPTDPKALDAQAKLIGKVQDLITSKCGPAQTDIPTIFACAGSSSVADLQSCLVCNGMNSMFDAMEQRYAESATFVPHAAGALQTAVNSSPAGTKLLVESGTYQEEVQVTTPNLKVVGCGGATNDRPKIQPPGTQVFGRGIRAFNVDGLLFQSLEVSGGWQSDGMFVSGANGISFIDIVGNGSDITRYAVFPVQSNNVLIELCNVEHIADAGIYVGQSSTLTVRYNQVRHSVAGIEFENSGNGQGYGNYAATNTGGHLVFKDGSLPVQLSQCHDIHHNVYEDNNTANFGSGTVSGVPTGTGMLVVSNDQSTFSYNISRNNNSLGIGLVDQGNAGLPVSESSLDQNYVFNNVFTDNGTDPDPVRLPAGAQGNFTFIAFAQTGNCQSGNVLANGMPITPTILVFGPPVTSCTVPPVPFPTCPAPPISTTTTTSTSTSTSTVTTTSSTTTTLFGSPSAAFVDRAAR